MKKRNLVLLGTAAVLALSVAGTLGTVAVASAATLSEADESGATASTKVTYSVADKWSVIIPDALTVNGDGQTVSASGVKIEPDHTLKIAVTSQNDWTVKKNGTEGSGITYKLTAGGAEITDEVLTVEAGTDSGSKEIKAELAEGSENYSTGGTEYSDQLTFTVTNEAA